MKKYILLIATLLCGMPCPLQAHSGETRALELVLDSAPNVIRGTMVGSSIDSCGLKPAPQSAYTLRVTKTLKGETLYGDIKLCGTTAPLLLGKQYVVSGTLLNNEEFEFDIDGVILFFPPDRYYRLISYDSPIVASDLGDAYAVGLLRADFSALLAEFFGEQD